MTSLAFMLVWVPEPVWNTTSGNSWSCMPAMTSSAARAISATLSSGSSARRPSAPPPARLPSQPAPTAAAISGGGDVGALVLEAIGEAVYAMDRDLRILFANPKALELWDKAPEQVIGRPLLEVFPGIEDGEPYQAY